MKIGLTLPLVTVSLLTPLGWSQTASQMPPAKPAAAAAPNASQDPNRVVATINGQKITAKQVEEMLKPFPPDQRKQIDANLSKAVEQIYMNQQLSEAAEKLNLERQSPWKEQIELNRRGILARAYVSHLSDEAAKETPEDPQKYYDTHKAEFEFAKLSGIFVGFNAPGTPASNAANARTEEAAHEKVNELEKKLAAGGDFSALARAESEHSSASKGGDLGNIPINDPQVQIPADIKTAVAKLQPGQVSEPVKIPGAYLIVKLDAREVTPFDRAKSGIEQKLQTERSTNVVKKETEKYAIHVDDQAFFSNGGASTASSPKIPSLQRPATPAR
jgi:hypothetical protein